MTFISFFGLLILISRDVVSPLPGITIYSLDSEEVTYLLFRQSSFKEILQAIQCSTSFIYLCFLTLRLPKLVMLTSENFSSHNVFWVEQLWYIVGVGITTARSFMLMLQKKTVYLKCELLILLYLFINGFINTVFTLFYRTVLNIIFIILNSSPSL